MCVCIYIYIYIYTKTYTFPVYKNIKAKTHKYSKLSYLAFEGTISLPPQNKTNKEIESVKNKVHIVVRINTSR